MKNLKKISLISFLACATLAGGILTANTEVEAPVQEQKFYMVDGAQIRVPDVVEEGAEDFDGLRFIAKMTDSYRVARGELENMSVGMFFLPAEKVDTINEAAVFGENATYYWDGCGYEKGDRLEIVHKETYAFEETKGDDFLTIKCSLWNLLPGTLGREIGAVAYLRVNVGTKEEPVYEYHFAETGAGAKAVSVAQKALLNKKDAIHAEEGAADRVNAAYVTPFLGEEGVEVAYTETIYKQQKDGSYARIEENVEKTGVVKAYNTQAPKAYDNYEVYSRESTARNLLIDGSAVITTYYNYAGNRVVLWDGDEYLSDSSYVHKQLDEFAMQILPDNFYEGNYALMYNTEGWEGPWWKTGKVLPAATDTFSMIMEMGNDPETDEPTVYNDWDVYLYYTSGEYVMPASMTFENLETGEVTEVEGAVTNVATGFYKLTMKFANAYSQITGFGFRVQTSDGFPVWKMDNLCAENVVEFKGFTLPHTFKDTITFNAPEVFDTSAWDGEAGECEVYYKAEGADDWSSLTAENGVYSFTAEADVARYDVKAVAGDLEVVRTTIKGTVWADFETATAERDYVVSDTYNSIGLWDKSDKPEWMVSVDGFDGKFMTANVEGAWVYVHFKESSSAKTFNAVNGGVAPTRMGAWIYAPKAFTLDCAAKLWGRFGYGVGSLEIQAGYHYYEFNMPANWGTKDAMAAFVFDYANYYVDAVVLY